MGCPVGEMEKISKAYISPHNNIYVLDIEAETQWLSFSNDIFKCILLNENVWMSIKISLKCFPKGPIYNIPAFVQIMVIIWTNDGWVTDAYMHHSATMHWYGKGRLKSSNMCF